MELLKTFLIALAVAFLGSLAAAYLYDNDPAISENMQPQYLYKVLSVSNWEESQKSSQLILSSMDKKFIHLSTEDQLEKIINKFWGQEAQYVVLKLDSAKLMGKLVYEANPGGTTQYYHLYDGSIPLSAVTEAKVITK